MKKGYSLIEAIIVISLVGILLLISSLSVEKIKEKRSIEEGKNRIIEVLKLYSESSYYDGKVYEISIDLGEKKLEVVSSDDGEQKDYIVLPQDIEYYINLDRDGNKEFEKVKTTVNGGLSSFSIYIFGYDGKARYRIASDGINASKLVHINVYRNKNSGASFGNIEEYTYDKSKWEKQ